MNPPTSEGECVWHGITPSLFVLGVFGLTALLSAVIPGPEIKGYATDKRGQVLKYRLNGLLVWILMVAGPWAVHTLAPGEMFPLHCLYTEIYETLFLSFILGVALSLIMFYMGPGGACAPKRQRDVDAYSKKTGTVKQLEHFFFGFRLNPRRGLFDVKMFLYLYGAVLLGLNILGALAYSQHHHGMVSEGAQVYGTLMMWFLIDYMWHEHVHLYTYDLVDENVGFKLTWGCCFFYPYFYMIGLVPLVSAEGLHPLPTWQAVLSAVCFFAGWVLSRGANNQKYYFKIGYPKERRFLLGLVEQRALTVSTPSGGQRQVLCSGWWGLSRHINYLGEILMAVGLAWPGGTISVLPWMYPLYYVGLLIPRERDDHVRCEERYGAAWKRYVNRVPYRIIPGVY